MFTALKGSLVEKGRALEKVLNYLSNFEEARKTLSSKIKEVEFSLQKEKEGNFKEVKAHEDNLRKVKKELNNSVTENVHDVHGTFKNILNHVDFLCPEVDIPRELMNLETEVVYGKLVSDEE